MADSPLHGLRFFSAFASVFPILFRLLHLGSSLCPVLIFGQRFLPSFCVPYPGVPPGPVHPEACFPLGLTPFPVFCLVSGMVPAFVVVSVRWFVPAPPIITSCSVPRLFSDYASSRFLPLFCASHPRCVSRSRPFCSLLFSSFPAVYSLSHISGGLCRLLSGSAP